jgi:hypothetical protein
MKYFIIIIITFLVLLIGTETKLSNTPEIKAYKDCMDAEYVHEVQSFYSDNPGSQKRNQIEFWEDRIFIPIIKHD